MIEFILNNEDVTTDQPPGMTVLDFVRYYKNLKGTKIGCREGDCGACTILVGELRDGLVSYRTMTSCLMPLANAAGKHIVTIEGINPPDGSLTPVQQAMVDENGTQCGFCTVGFVMSLTGFCIDHVSSPHVVSGPHVVSSPHVSKGSLVDAAMSSMDGNICRCTGYKSIERAAKRVCGFLSEPPASAGGQSAMLPEYFASIAPQYFASIAPRLEAIWSTASENASQTGRPITQAVPTFVGGGTDVYVQRPDAMAEAEASHIFYDKDLRGIRDLGHSIEIGASATVTDLLESPVMQAAFPDLYKHLKLVSSTPIRNMATLAGNFINASPIGDMTVWFLALNAEILLNSPRVLGGVAAASADGVVEREMLLKQLYLGYKQLAKSPDEYIKAIRFKKPTADHYFNFEKVCKRTYLDIATVNTAILLKCESLPGQAWTPPALSVPPAVAGGDLSPQRRRDGETHDSVEYNILDAHVSAGGVAPIPLYLKETSSFLVGRTVNEETIAKANEIMQLEISPISDVRGTESYKRLLLRQLFRAHFVELFNF
jgi:xanthine dehydrogenase small subunit